MGTWSLEEPTLASVSVAPSSLESWLCAPDSPAQACRSLGRKKMETMHLSYGHESTRGRRLVFPREFSVAQK